MFIVVACLLESPPSAIGSIAFSTADINVSCSIRAVPMAWLHVPDRSATKYRKTPLVTSFDWPPADN